MRKCTLCVDRIYNDTLAPAERVPACVSCCPVSARSFGDLADPASAVSVTVAERGGYDLMPEQDCRPVNKYLPPQARRIGGATQSTPNAAAEPSDAGSKFLRWLDRMLSR
jgi:sulfite dehydrogenase (quinone) subunit SoeB